MVKNAVNTDFTGTLCFENQQNTTITKKNRKFAP